MSLQKSKAKRNRLNVYLGFFLVFVLAASALAPLVQTSQNQVIPPTPTNAPQRPTPISDLSTITFDTQHQHKTGIFSVSVPSGWDTVADTNNATEVQTSMRNSNAQSVLDARVISPLTPVESTDDLQEFFNAEWLGSSWRDYTTWSEVGRKVENDRLVIDFTLGRGLQSFIARQVSYTDGEWIYNVRVITPPDSTNVALHLLDNTLENFKPNNALYGVAFDWSGFVDTNNGALVRFPNSWQVVDSGLNAPTSLSGDGNTIRIERISQAIADSTAAQQWVSDNVANATISDVSEVNNFGTTGYRVAYQVSNLDGDLESGFAVILPDGDSAVIANARVPQANVSLESNPNLNTILSEITLLASN